MPVDPALCPDLFVWTDTCNVYVLRDGQAALLIDLGDAQVLDHLADIGVNRVEWVLFTHHHREQCQGYPRLAGQGARIGVPEAERALFERPAAFRKMKPSLNDPVTVHGASYVRPPIQPIQVDRGLAGMEEFEWHGRRLRCVPTKGNSPGAMSYLLSCEGKWVAFSGDVCLDGARMHNWFDSEWDYGFAAGIYALSDSAAMLESFRPVLLLPSQGPAMHEPVKQLQTYQARLRRLERLLLRGYSLYRFAGADQDPVSRPTAVLRIWQISPHLFKIKAPDPWVNFTLLLADSGHALAIDCGLLDKAMLDESIELMRQRLGLKNIDATIVTHMHGDHILQAPHLRDKYGTQIWTLASIAGKFERPQAYEYAALVNAYGVGLDSVRIDRTFKPGETFEWEGYRLTVDWMPGQTEFGLCLHGMIDGKKVAFTGDNIFGLPADPAQSGHEAVVARNSAILEEGYIYAGEYLQRLKPDLMVGGHSWVMDLPAGMIERYHRWALDMREASRELSADEDYRYWFDPYWVRVEPYRVKVKGGASAEVQVHIRNFRQREQRHRIAVHAPAGLTAEPAVLEGGLRAEAREALPVRLKAAPNAPAGTAIVALDVTLDGRRYGEWFDCIVEVK